MAGWYLDHPDFCHEHDLPGVLSSSVLHGVSKSDGSALGTLSQKIRRSKNRIVAAILAIFIVFHESIGTIAAIWQIVDTSIPGSDFRVTGVIIAGASSAAADIIIAVVLFISLWRISTAYTRTKNTFKRISIHAAACGLISATATVVDLVLLFKNYTGFLVIFTILGRLYTLTLLANLLLLKRLAKNETTIYTTDPTLRQNTMTVDRATESIAFSTRISGDANGTCDRSFTIPIELSMQYSITEEGHSTQASQTSNFDHHIKPCSSPVAPKPNIELTVSQITHEV
ncbi:hypothetical protein VKT23_005072 [Stygiomarasmius scandens]|uniref:DUF6534 domain-containing protein n=1 Tax=Marasmiellus scandens TaxID=2682957 RepID=A0ABR1JTL0_9AGAR